MPMRYKALFAVIFAASMTVATLSSATAQQLPGDLLQRGNEARQQGEWEKALQSYRQFLQQNPEHEAAVLAHFAAGECLYKLKRYEQAEQQYRTVFENYPDWSDVPAAYLRAGTSLFYLGQYERAADTLQTALEKFGSSSIAGTIAYWLGEALYQQGDRQAAIEAYERSLHLAPEGDLAPYALYSIATTYSDTDPQKAVKAFAELHARFPESELQAEALYRTGSLHERQENYGDASESYEAVIEQFPDSQYAPRAMLGIASVYYRRGEFARAAAEFEKVSEQYAGSDIAIQASVRAADARYAAGDYEAAAEAYTAVAGSGSSEFASSAAYWGAVSYQLAGKTSEAIEAFENLLNTYPDHPEIADACIRLGGLYLDRGDFTRAQAAYKQAAEKATDEAEKLKAQFGELWTQHQKTGSAETLDALASFLLQHPQSSVARNNALFAANLEMGAGNSQMALHLSQLILEYHPEYPGIAEALTIAGQAHRKMNTPGAARDAFNRVLQEYADTSSADVARSELAFMHLQDGNVQEGAALIDAISPDGAAHDTLPRLYYRLGEKYAASDNWEDAVAAYQRAYEVASEGEWAETALMATADAQVADNQLVAALDTYTQFIQQFPESPDIGRAHVQRGKTLVRLNRHREAVTYYTSVLQAHNDAAWAPEVAFALGEVYVDHTQIVRAVEAFVDLADTYPESELAPDALFTAAELRYEQSNFSASSRLYERLIEEHPQCDLTDEAHYKLGWSLLKMQERTAALEHFLAAVERSDNPAVAADARLQAGYIYMHNEQFDNAIEMLKPGIQNESDQQLPSMLHLLAEAYASVDQSAEAVTVMERLTTDFPEYAYIQQSRLRLAQMYADIEEYEKAAAILNDLRKAEDRQLSHKATMELAEIKRASQQFEDAAELYLTVADGTHDDELAARALYRAGTTYQRMGDAEQAVELYRRLLRDYPEQSPWAPRAETRLERLTQDDE
ncbi:MAG: tetratricopeptide repeat protein [Armatimonadota bacterium]